MNRFRIFSLLAALACAVSLKAQETHIGRTSFDTDWKFSLKADSSAILPGYNDADWRSLHLPHDWSIEGEYSETGGGDWQSGYLPGGIGWYRKTFSMQPGWEGKLVSIYFDGVYLNSDVWINGKHLGFRPNGYISFSYLLSPWLKPGKNTIVVRVNHEKVKSGRWYTGSGIYRHVWLDVKNPSHILNGEAYLTTPVVKKEAAVLKCAIPVFNGEKKGGAFTMRWNITAPSGKSIRKTSSFTLKKDERKEIVQELKIANPEPWSPDHPSLYAVQISLEKEGKVIDEFHTKTGIRTFSFSGEWGCKLNGELLKFKGVCLHQDAGAFGVAVPDQVWLQRLLQLKEMGANAIRTSHHPFAPVVYGICDSIGLMVMNEAFDGWEKPKAADDYGNYFDDWWETDLRAFVLRDRNHPSVVMWSVGNEVPKPQYDIQKKLVDLVHELDPGRPVTQGGVDPTRGMKDAGLKLLLDIKGFNGDGEEIGAYEEYHEAFPEVPVIGTEVPHTYQTRGYYKTTTHWRKKDFPAVWEIRSGNAGTMKGLEKKVFPIPDLSEEEVFPESGATHYRKNGALLPIPNTATWARDLYYQSSYDNATVRSSARKAWQRTRDLPYVMGQFRWTGFDYLGETNQWPSRFANFGVIDICGFPKDHFFLYQSMWTETPMVHLLPHWTHPGKDGTKIPVVVYTNTEEAELFLNGKSLGKKTYKDEQLVWNVPYAPGVLKVVAYNKGKSVTESKTETAGKPYALSVKRRENLSGSNKNPVSIFEITITDKNGIHVPDAGNLLNFEVSGSAKLKASDNGDPLDISNYGNSYRNAFHGKCILILENASEGESEIRIHSEGLKSALLRLPQSN